MALNEHKLSKQGNGARDPAEFGHHPRDLKPQFKQVGEESRQAFKNSLGTEAEEVRTGPLKASTEGGDNLVKEAFYDVVQGTTKAVNSGVETVNELGHKIVETVKKTFA